MHFRNFDLNGNNLTLYQQALGNKIVTLVNHGTLDDLIPNEEPSTIILPQGSLAAKKYGIGFLKEEIKYEEGKDVNLDYITAIAGYGTSISWGDFVGQVKLERLRVITMTRSGFIMLK